MDKFKKTILIDLDGVLNTYDGKYNENYIPPIKDGAYDLIKELSLDYKIVIFTTRNSLITSKWFIENNLDKYIENSMRQLFITTLLYQLQKILLFYLVYQ